MPSTNKTQYYELNQWQGNEYPKRADFVADNAAIDAALHDLDECKLDETGDGSDVTAAFSEAGTRANIGTGETLAVIFGKIKKFFTDLKAVAFSGSYNDLTDKPTLFDSTNPSTQNYGDEAYSGIATTAARRDHKHAMPASTKDKTDVTGVLKGNGTSISAAVRGTDYSLALAGTGTIASSASWSGPDAQGYYTYAVTAPGVLSTDNVDITRVLNMADKAASDLIQEAWNKVTDVVITANTLTFYATEAPSVAIPIAWKAVR